MPRGRERERGRKRAASSGSTLKLTKEFRFLYNRFNLILALDRSGEDVSGERISISERYSPDPPRLPACPLSSPCSLFPPPPSYNFSFFSRSRMAVVRAHNREGSIFRYRRVGDTMGTYGYFNHHKNSSFYFYSRIHAMLSRGFSSFFFFFFTRESLPRARRSDVA